MEDLAVGRLGLVAGDFDVVELNVLPDKRCELVDDVRHKVDVVAGGVDPDVDCDVDAVERPQDDGHLVPFHLRKTVQQRMMFERRINKTNKRQADEKTRIHLLRQDGPFRAQTCASSCA